ncbi:MAG TPA: hypothetical protein VGN61_12045 [Verrucomicrobiae bacterium]
MSLARREQIEVEEQAAPAIRILVRQTETNGSALNGHSNRARKPRLFRAELLALGWESRLKRLGVK